MDKRRKQKLTNDDFVQQIHQKVEEANRDVEVMEFMTLEEEMKVQEAFAFERGMEKGIEQGRTEGIAEGEKFGFSKGEKSGFSKGEQSGAAQKQCEIARNLKALGLELDKISKSTGLTLKEVTEL